MALLAIPHDELQLMALMLQQQQEDGAALDGEDRDVIGFGPGLVKDLSLDNITI